MAVSVRASSKADSTTGTSISLSAPAGTAAGDFVVCLVQANGQTTIVDDTAPAISATNKTSGRDTDGNSTATTASVTPTANKLQLLTVTSRTNITADPNIPTITGNGLTWVQINSIIYDTTSASRRRVTLFRALGSSPSAGTISIDFGGQNQTHVSWILDEVTNADTSGTNGSGAIVQSATAKDETGTSTSISVTLSAFGSANNGAYGSFGDVDSTLTYSAGSGFTLLGSEQGGVVDITTHTEYKASNDTTVDYSADNFIFPGAIAIEIKAQTIFTEDINDYKPNTTSGHTLSIFSRTIQTGDPSTYSFISGASGRWSVIAITFQGTTPSYDVSPNTANATNTDDSTSGTMTVPVITTATDNAIHVTVGCWDTSATGSITTPTGYTLLQNANSGGEPMHASYKVITPAGSTGTTQIINSEFGARIGISFAVKETSTTSVKTADGLAKASVKTKLGLANASVKTFNGLA